MLDKIIKPAEKIKNDTQQTLSKIKKRQNDVKLEIENIQQESKNKIKLIEDNFHIISKHNLLLINHLHL